MIDLDKKYIEFIKNGFSQYLNNYKLYIFGSRSKGTAKKYSDIDLAVESSELTEEIKTKIDIYFMNSTIPYKMDIVNLNTLNEPFKNLITPDLTLL